MVNGSSSEHHYDGTRFVQRSELDYVHRKVETNTIDIAVISSRIEDISDMKDSIKSIEEKINTFTGVYKTLMGISIFCSTIVAVIEIMKYLGH